MIRIDDVSVTFGRGTPLETPALRALSLDVPDGQFLTVIGSNGSGKTTLLNSIAGLVALERGRIALGEVDITGWPAAKRARWVARVFQNPLAGTCEGLTIEENLALAHHRTRQRGLGLALNHGLRTSFRDILASLGLGLENRLGDRMGLLSGGQRQAVSLLMATMGEAKVLLLDEHTSALDPKTAAFVLETTRRLVAARRLTTIMVTHSMRQALDVGERTVMLHQGRMAVDVAGEDRARLDVPDLMHLFERLHGAEIANDTLLL